MAYSMQAVRWSLERSCQFRCGDGWELPKQTAQQLADLRALSRALPDGRVVDGVCVTGWSYANPFRTVTGATDYQSQVAIPSSGFLLSDRFTEFGGTATVFETCASCEANALSNGLKSLAGCHGYLWARSESRELEEMLRKSLAELCASAEFFKVFQQTNPIWFGLWIETPLRREHARVLRPVLERAFADDDDDDAEMGHFLRALSVTEQYDMPLHVSLSPMEATDLGFHWIFPHCPRCKAPAPGARWQDYADETIECEACGASYVPGATCSQVRMDLHCDADDLETALGIEGFGRLVRSYAMSQGFSAEQAEDVWNEELRSRKLRRQTLAAIREKRESTPPVDVTSKLEDLGAQNFARPGVIRCPECATPLRTKLPKRCCKCGAEWE